VVVKAATSWLRISSDLGKLDEVFCWYQVGPCAYRVTQLNIIHYFGVRYSRAEGERKTIESRNMGVCPNLWTTIA
jgi:hypothetical protein